MTDGAALALAELVGLRAAARGLELGARRRTLSVQAGGYLSAYRGRGLEFEEVREGPAIYFIAEFRFFDEEWRHFEIFFRPDGADETLSFKFKHQMYEDLDD